MICYKGFNHDLTCTMGKGSFQYKVGETYKEEIAECAKTGFHAVEEPIQVLHWYSSKGARYCICEAKGDVHEDGYDRISCSELTLLKEVSREQIAALECEWMRKRPNREYDNFVKKNTGEAGKDEILIVRGTNPKASGDVGSTLFLVQEKGRIHEKEIVSIDVIKVTEETKGLIFRSGGKIDAENRAKKTPKA